MRELLALGLAVAASCSNPLAVSDCPDDVQITMSAGTTPEIDWTPRCHLYALTVSTYDDANVWIIHGPPQYLICSDYGPCPSALNTLYRPIRYGVVPRDAFQDVPPPDAQAPPLNVGWPYAVRLQRAGGAASQELFLAIDTFVVAATLIDIVDELDGLPARITSLDNRLSSACTTVRDELVDRSVVIPETDITKTGVVVGVFPRTTIRPFSGLGTLC